jgi:gliding motility associated protien GldN
MNIIKSLLVVMLFVMLNNRLLAQEKPVTMNPNSVYPVSEEHKLYKMTVWRNIDFKEKQNQPFFSSNNELSTIILEAVRDGRLVPYEDDSLTRRMTKEAFLDKIKINTGDTEGSLSSSGGSDWGTTATGTGTGTGTDAWGTAGAAGAAAATPTAAAPQYIFGKNLNLMEMKEEVYFDEIRSRMYNDIQSLTIFIPADQTATGVNLPVGTFRYKDLEKLFRSMPDRAIWYNRQNTAQNRNMADAFLLRLFSSRVTRISNPQNETIEDTYTDPKLSLYMSQVLEHKMMEYEHDLWEY